MRDDGGIVRDGQQIDHQHAHGALQHPAGGVHPLRGNVHAVVEPPHAGRLHEHDQQRGEAQLDEHARREDAAQTGGIALAQAHGQEAADRRGHGGREEGEHGHHAAHGVVDAIVVDAQRPEHHTRGEQADQHQQEHAEVQQKGVARQSSAVLRKMSCSRRHKLIPLPQLHPAAP